VVIYLFAAAFGILLFHIDSRITEDVEKESRFTDVSSLKV